MKRALLLAGALLALVAPAAHADVPYGGSVLYKSSLGNGSISLTRHDNGRITGRVNVGHHCKGYAAGYSIIRVKGAANGTAFTASGSTRTRPGRVRLSLKGTLDGPNGAGRMTARMSRCLRFTRPFVLRTPSAPVGGPVLPARGSLFYGFSAQLAGGAPLPVSLRVAKNGRVYAIWEAISACRRNFKFPVVNVTPTTKVRPDGSFSRTENYTVRFSDAPTRRFHVNFRGRFMADGAVGTLSATVRFYDRGKAYATCRSGTVNWAARP
jgi:hypothetical protein